MHVKKVTVLTGGWWHPLDVGELALLCTQMYFHTVESVWAPKKWAQIFKNFNIFLTLISLITVHSSDLIVL